MSDTLICTCQLASRRPPGGGRVLRGGDGHSALATDKGSGVEERDSPSVLGRRAGMGHSVVFEIVLGFVGGPSGVDLIAPMSLGDCW
jgi:hypothetical protein